MIKEKIKKFQKENLNSTIDYKSDEETISQDNQNTIEIIINDNTDSEFFDKTNNKNKKVKNKNIIHKEFRDVGTQTYKIPYLYNIIYGKQIEKIQEKKNKKKYLQKNRKNIFKSIFENKIEKKSLIGRKRKNDKRVARHNKFSYDNCIYKIKNKCFNCIFLTLNSLIKKEDPNDQIKKIDGNIFKNGTKIFNLQFLEKKISDIFLYKISSKYTLQYENNNQNIIEKYSTNKLIQEILNMTFEECINNIFTMSSEEFKKKYNFENKYLLEKLKKDDEYSNLKELIDTGLSRYFLDIKERKIRNKVNYENI